MSGDGRCTSCRHGDKSSPPEKSPWEELSLRHNLLISAESNSEWIKAFSEMVQNMGSEVDHQIGGLDLLSM